MAFLSSTGLMHTCIARGIPASILAPKVPFTALSFYITQLPWQQKHRPGSIKRTGLSQLSHMCNLKTSNLFVPSQHYEQRTFIQTLVNNHSNSYSVKSKHLLVPNQETSALRIPHRDLSFNTKTVLEASPKSLQPYLRLIRFDRPIGSFLLFWPCSWSIGLAAEAGHLPNLYILALFAAGSFFMRGAGCIINDMWDKDIDKKVERTKMRPLASGELSYFQALCCLAGNLSVSLAILLQLNNYSIVLGASAMILVIMYPLAKRFTNWPQIMLGMTLNWGVLLGWSHLHGCLEWPVIPLYIACMLYTMFYDTIYAHQTGLTFNYGAMLGWCAVKGGVDWPVLPLYTSCLLWTLIYDTIYAHQDKYDDMLIGVRSTALTLGGKTKPWLAGFSSVMISGLTLTGVLCDQTWPYYAAVTATAAHLVYQLYSVNLDDPDDCFAKFKYNSKLGLVMFIGIVTGTLLKPRKTEDDMGISA